MCYFQRTDRVLPTTLAIVLASEALRGYTLCEVSLDLEQRIKITAQGWKTGFDQVLDTSLAMLHADLMSIQLIFHTGTL
jgi:hypothetical protein